MWGYANTKGSYHCCGEALLRASSVPADSLSAAAEASRHQEVRTIELRGGREIRRFRLSLIEHLIATAGPKINKNKNKKQFTIISNIPIWPIAFIFRKRRPRHLQYGA
jgi:hypothetical protein